MDWNAKSSVNRDALARDPALSEIVRGLVEAYEPVRIYLFGSKARGDAGPDSDYDLMVIVPDDAAAERKSSRLAYQALSGTGIAKDVLVYTHSYFEVRRHLKASLPATILREGKILYSTPYDPILVQDTRAWTKRACADLRAAEHVMAMEPPALGMAVFYCQQAVEKAMRALLTWHDVPFGKTYDLQKIGEACVQVDQSLAKRTSRAGTLTEYAWKYRYPPGPAQPPQAEAESALSLARGLYEAVMERLPEEVQP